MERNRAVLSMVIGKSIIVIPCYNEAENIVKLIPEIFKFLDDSSVLVVDDSSKDQTGKTVLELAEKYKNRVFIINRTGERSFAKSYVEGFLWALGQNYDFIFQMDGDFSHHPKYLPELREKTKEYGLVIGSRYCKQAGAEKEWGIKRLAFSVLANFYARAITGLPLRDITGGFKCFKRQVLETIDFGKISSNGFAFQIETNWLVWKAGFKVGEIPIIFYNRKYGKSKLSLNKIIEGLWIPIKIKLS